MLPSHEVCPICNKKIHHIKCISKKCPILNIDSLSFIESICNNVDTTIIDKKIEHSIHLFFEITSLYGELLYMKVNFPYYNSGVDVEVNYSLHKSTITYFNKPIFDKNKFRINKFAEILVLENRLLELDFPTLEKTIKKIKTIAPFL